MCSESGIRLDVAKGVKEAGNFLLTMMDRPRVADYNDALQHRNLKVIRWLQEHQAPVEMIEQALEDSTQGNNAILTVIDEIRLSGNYKVVPSEVLDLILDAAGERAKALFIQLCQEYDGEGETGDCEQ